MPKKTQAKLADHKFDTELAHKETEAMRKEFEELKDDDPKKEELRKKLDTKEVENDADLNQGMSTGRYVGNVTIMSTLWTCALFNHY